MTRRPRSDVTWQRAEPRRRVRPLLLPLIVIAAVAAFIAYMNVGIFDRLGVGTAPAPETAADVAPMRKPGRQRGTGSLRLSTAPRPGPMPRRAVSPAAGTAAARRYDGTRLPLSSEQRKAQDKQRC